MLSMQGSKVYVAGHRGLVGSAIWRYLDKNRQVGLVGRSRDELNLLDENAVNRFFSEERPDYVFFAAAKVGGIHANHVYPVDFLELNLRMELNLIRAAHEHDVRKLLFLGSSCIYPKYAEQPIQEASLMTGALEPTNEWYAIAKIAGIRLCQAYRRQYGRDFISAMPTNMYGPNDNYDLESSHVLPAMIRRFHDAREGGLESVTCWGSGQPRREFLYSDDLAAACVFLMEHYSEEEHINVGFGQDVTIRELAETVAATVGFQGAIHWDTSKPDGTPRKLMDSGRLLAMGWKPTVDLATGIRLAYESFLKGQRRH